MADDDAPASAPWGRSGRRAPGQSTPAPSPGPATPPPVEPATWVAPAPGTPAPAPPGTPAPPPGTPDVPFGAPTPQPLSLDKPGADPVHAPPASGQHWTVPDPGSAVGGVGGPTYPLGGFPPPPPPKKGGGGAVVAVVAIVVVLLLLAAAVVGLFVLRSDDDGDEAGATSSTATSPVTPGGSGDTEPGTTELPPTSEGPGTSDAPGTTEPPTTDTSVPSTPSVPSTDDLVPPDVFPRPSGANPGIVGLEVPNLSVAEVRDFYLEALPAAGFTVGDVQDLGTIIVIPVEGNGLRGQLSITDVAPLPTSVIWTAY